MLSFLFTVFWIALAAFAIGILIGIVVFVPLGIYNFPYSYWVHLQQKQYKISDILESDQYSPIRKMFFEAKNATKLYRSWITKKPHNITRF